MVDRVKFFLHDSGMTLLDLRKRLRESSGKLREIERATGVKYQTIRAIRDGASVNPRVDHFSALARYFGAEGVPVESR